MLAAWPRLASQLLSKRTEPARAIRASEEKDDGKEQAGGEESEEARDQEADQQDPDIDRHSGPRLVITGIHWPEVIP